MSLRLGILAIGSLFWDENSARNNWRKSRLNVDESFHVKVPIRYGRRSNKRGNSYTMVFSTELLLKKELLGTGIAMPCRNTVLSLEDLVTEAELLWAAERNCEESNGRLSASWGAVALLINSRQQGELRLIAEAWSRKVNERENYGKLVSRPNESCAVNKLGCLNIPWPESAEGQLTDFDLLLATATNPTIEIEDYPSVANISNAWKAESGMQFADYFWNNRKHGITTFQDEEIERLMKGNEIMAKELEKS